jgi:hypothetical protein
MGLFDACGGGVDGALGAFESVRIARVQGEGREAIGGMEEIEHLGGVDVGLNDLVVEVVDGRFEVGFAPAFEGDAMVAGCDADTALVVGEVATECAIESIQGFGGANLFRCRGRRLGIGEKGAGNEERSREGRGDE